MGRLIYSCFNHRNVENLCFKELWDVEDDGEDNNSNNILGDSIIDTGSYSISVVERVADSTVSEDEDDQNDDEEQDSTFPMLWPLSAL